jgi:hypothetical protein
MRHLRTLVSVALCCMHVIDALNVCSTRHPPPLYAQLPTVRPAAASSTFSSCVDLCAMQAGVARKTQLSCLLLLRHSLNQARPLLEQACLPAKLFDWLLQRHLRAVHNTFCLYIVYLDNLQDSLASMVTGKPLLTARCQPILSMCM